MASKKHNNSCPIPNGIVLLIGGKENKGEKPEKPEPGNQMEKKLEILGAFIKLTGKKDPAIELCTSGSSEGEASFEEYKTAFAKLGVHHLHHMHHNERKEVLEDGLVERVNKADAIFFAGGDQLLLTGLYGGSPFLTRLKERYISDKIVVAGTSAGAMALSTPMIYAGSSEVQEYGGQIKITTGLEFLKDVCVDTHFVDRGRFVRMAQVIMTNPTCIGLGIEEDTALIIRNGIEGEVIGSGMIIVIDGFNIERTNLNEFTDEKPVSIHNLKVHLIIKGEKYVLPQVNPPHQ